MPMRLLCQLPRSVSRELERQLRFRCFHNRATQDDSDTSSSLSGSSCTDDEALLILSPTFDLALAEDRR